MSKGVEVKVISADISGNVEDIANSIADALGIDPKTRDELKEKARARAVRVLEESKEDIDFEEVFTQLEELTGKLDVDEVTRKKIIELTKEGSERVAEYFKKKSEEKEECSGKCGCKGCRCLDKMEEAVRKVLYDGFVNRPAVCETPKKVAETIAEAIKDITEIHHPGLVYRDALSVIEMLKRTPRYQHVLELANGNRSKLQDNFLPTVLFSSENIDKMADDNNTESYAELFVKLMFNYAMNFDVTDRGCERSEPKVNISHGIDNLILLLGLGPNHYMLVILLETVFTKKFGTIKEYKELDIETKSDAVELVLRDLLPKLKKEDRAWLMGVVCSGIEPATKFITFYFPKFVREILLEADQVEGALLSETMIEVITDCMEDDKEKKCGCSCSCKK